MMIQALLTSSVIAALVGAFVALRSSERRIAIENITQERAKWREKIRCSAAEVAAALTAQDAAGLAKAKLALSLLLNPTDPDDRAIINVVSGDDLGATRAEEFHIHVSLLLKHDWERAKKESTSLLPRRKVARLSYQAYLATLGPNPAPAGKSSTAVGPVQELA
jgi:hypothetical protein